MKRIQTPIQVLDYSAVEVDGSLVDFPTQGENTLDLILTNIPDKIKNVTGFDNILGADHLTFEGGGGWFWKIISCKAILNKKNTCTNKLGEKISCPSIWWGKKCCKTAWLQGSIWPVREDKLVWFSGTSVRLISCWKTPQNAGHSLSELQKIQNFLGGGMPPDPSRGLHLWWSTQLSQSPS